MKISLAKLASRVICWCSFAALYLVLSASTDASEVVAAALSASFVLFLVIRLRGTFSTPLRIKPRWLLLLWRIPYAMLQESWLLLGALLREIAGKGAPGRLLEHPLPELSDGHDPARRAFMTFGVCVTPNSYLVFEDRENGRALVRQLVGEELSEIDRLFLELS